MGVFQVIWVSGSFKRRRKKAHIKNLGTPLSLGFKIFWGTGSPPGSESYRRMFAVSDIDPSGSLVAAPVTTFTALGEGPPLAQAWQGRVGCVELFVYTGK